MKIAVAIENGAVCPHFGHAPIFRIYQVEEKKIVSHEDHPNPGHAPGVLPRWLSEMKADIIIAGGMGPRAEELFRAAGVEPVIGASGNADQAASDYLEGKLSTGPSACHHT